MKFSVIVPAHNAEKHINTLLQSIRTQSFEDYELIVVCDRCTDFTETIAKHYQAKTVNVDYGSDGLSRDKGLEMATGDWILFADDDDWFVHEFCFQQVADATEKCDSDVVAFGYLCKGQGYVEPSFDTIFLPGKAHVWSNCWKRSSIRGAKFGDAVFCSDTYFVRDMKRRVNSYSVLNMPIYYYNFMREGSQTDMLMRGQILQSPVAR